MNCKWHLVITIGEVSSPSINLSPISLQTPKCIGDKTARQLRLVHALQLPFPSQCKQTKTKMWDWTPHIILHTHEHASSVFNIYLWGSAVITTLSLMKFSSKYGAASATGVEHLGGSAQVSSSIAPPTSSSAPVLTAETESCSVKAQFCAQLFCWWQFLLSMHQPQS